MKDKKQVLIYSIILIILVLMTTVVIATTSDLSQLKNTAYTKIGNNFILNYDSLTSNNNTYCI